MASAETKQKWREYGHQVVQDPGRAIRGFARYTIAICVLAFALGFVAAMIVWPWLPEAVRNR